MSDEQLMQNETSEQESVDEHPIDPRGELVGEVHITVWEHDVPEVKFTGNLASRHISRAWRAMMKQYRQWKHNVFHELEKEKKEDKL